MSIREPAVAGMFYPANPSALEDQIEACFLAQGAPGIIPIVDPNGPRKIVGLVCPHAGYMYSGPASACAYYRLAGDGLPEVAVIIGPNHHSYSPAAALSDHSAWRTPLGAILVDSEVTRSIAKHSASAEIDSRAFASEHSVEVQVPFLQYLAAGAGAHISIVPVLIGAMGFANPLEFARDLGQSIANALNGRNCLVIASTDFTHFENSQSAALKDTQAISKILALDEGGLMETVESMDISMCGALPTAIAITACKHLGAVSVERLAYQNSGDITGDYSNVVGYGALEIRRA
jgi:hypothetical protein